MTGLGPPAPATRVGDMVALSRTTRDGRRLYYELVVLQQPERARACGSGPKSSADRRPVDPPPVVQMKIWEGPTREQAKDITFMYNADFFLYASLHHARDPTSGRVAPPSTPPVLTGMPVSSMILLDRPEEAGYFIFSDLSVRHEGHYFLTFALMEEVKEDKDKDADEHMSGTDEITGPDMGPNGRHFSFRTTVQTDDFAVYSAKKFPGLQESTALSRTVAEQGCRVRIRRDVRMRRREKGKGGSGKDVSSLEDEFAKNARTEVSPSNIRGRSSSNASMDPAAYHSDLQQRRASGMGMEFAPPRQSFAASEPSTNRHLTFGGQPMPPHYAPHSHSVPTSPSYPPPGTSYGRKSSYAPYQERSPIQPYAPQSAGPAPPREPYPFRVPPPGPILAPKLEPDMEPQKPREILPSLSEFANFANGAPPVRRSSYTPQPQASRRPSLLPHLPPHHRTDQNSPPLPLFHQKQESIAPPQPPSATMAPSSYMPTPGSSKKRTADEAFPSSEYQRMQNGRRQSDLPPDAPYRVDPKDQHYVWSTASYERADLTIVKVPFPPPVVRN